MMKLKKRLNSQEELLEGQKEVRITEVLLKEVTNAKDLSQVKVLNFNSRSTDNGVITRIEGLQNVPGLIELNISFNRIGIIENMSKCHYLKELNLSENIITKIDGLEQVPTLEVVNLNGNNISELPRQVLKQLPKIRVLKLIRNNIKDYNEIDNLNELRSLEILAISENPFCKIITYSEYCAYSIPRLKVLDSRKLDSEMKQNAKILFGNERQLGSQPEDNKYFTKYHQVSHLEEQLKEINNKSQEYRSKIQKLQKQCVKIKESITKRQLQRDDIAEQYFNMKNQIKRNGRNTPNNYNTNSRNKQQVNSINIIFTKIMFIMTIMIAQNKVNQSFNEILYDEDSNNSNLEEVEVERENNYMRHQKTIKTQESHLEIKEDSQQLKDLKRDIHIKQDELALLEENLKVNQISLEELRNLMDESISQEEKLAAQIQANQYLKMEEQSNTLFDSQENDDLVINSNMKQQQAELNQAFMELQNINNQKKIFLKSVNNLVSGIKNIINSYPNGIDCVSNSDDESNGNENKQRINQLFPQRIDSIDDWNQAFEGLQKVILKVQKNQEDIHNFKAIKATFLEEFEKETQELQSKWQKFQAKRLKHKMQQKEQEEELILQWSKLREEQERIQNGAEEILEKEMDYFKMQQIQNVQEKQYYEMEIHSLKAELYRLQQAEDEAKESKNTAEKDLLSIQIQFERQTNQLQDNYQQRDELQKEKNNLEVELNRLTNERREIEMINISLLEQKEQLLKETKKIESDMKIVFERFERDEQTSKRKLRELEDIFNQKQIHLKEIENAIEGKEASLSRMESIVIEYNIAKEKNQGVQVECAKVEKILNEKKLEIEENNRKMQGQMNELMILKQHVQGMSELLEQKSKEVEDMEIEGLRRNKMIEEFQRLCQQLQIQGSRLSEEVEELESIKRENVKEIQSYERQLSQRKYEFESFFKQQIQNKEKLEQQIEDRQLELDGLKVKYIEEYKRCKDMKEENSQILRKLQGSIEKTQGLLDSMEIELNGKENMLRNISEILQQKQKLLEELKKQLIDQEVLADRICGLQESCRNIENEERRLKERCENLKESIDQLEITVAELREEEIEILARVKCLQESEQTDLLFRCVGGEQLYQDDQQRVEQIIENSKKVMVFAEDNKRLQEINKMLMKEIQSQQKNEQLVYQERSQEQWNNYQEKSLDQEQEKLFGKWSRVRSVSNNNDSIRDNKYLSQEDRSQQKALNQHQNQSQLDQYKKDSGNKNNEEQMKNNSSNDRNTINSFEEKNNNNNSSLQQNIVSVDIIMQELDEANKIVQRSFEQQ